MRTSVSVAMMLFCDWHVVTLQELIAIVIVLVLQVHRQVRGSGIVFLCLTDILCLTGAPLRLPVANLVPFSASPESLQSDRGDTE